MRAAVAVALLLAASCGDADRARNQLIGDVCDLLRPCCQMAGLRDDGAECRLNLGAFSGHGFDPAAAEACIAELRAAAEDPAFCGVASLESGACRAVFPRTGTKAPGETCARDDQCAPPPAGAEGVVCAGASGASGEIRRCQIRRPGQAGDAPCVGTVDGAFVYTVPTASDVPPEGYLCDVADGLHCDDAGRCAPLGTSGSTCRSGLGECVPSAYCDLGAGRCADRKQVGAACTGSAECASEAFCGAGLTCVARSADGASCERSEECLSETCVGEICRPGSDNVALLLFCGVSGRT